MKIIITIEIEIPPWLEGFYMGPFYQRRWKLMKKPLEKNEADKLMAKYRQEYKEWRNNKKKEGFFVIYNSFFTNELLKTISGNSLKLYIYLGIHSKNNTGESWHSLERIAEYFEKDMRTIGRWIKELEDINLIKRVQKGLRIPNTFLIGYNKKEKEEDIHLQQEELPF